MDARKASMIERVVAIVCITILLIVDAATWKIDHALVATGIAAVAGLAGYSFGLHRNQAMMNASPGGTDEERAGH